MSILLAINFDLTRHLPIYEEVFAPRKVQVWEKDGFDQAQLDEIEFALVWKPDHGLMRRLKNLKAIFSLGAGVNHVFEDPNLPPGVPIVRFVDSNLTNRMSEWVVLQCLMHLRRQRLYDQQQSTCNWDDHEQPIASEIRVGIMGLGELGRDAAQKLSHIGFQVSGWSRTKKQIAGIKSYDETQLDQFLTATDILVSLLPLTDATRGLLNAKLIDGLAKDGALGAPVIINAGRGGSQVETDLIAALESGALGGVSLDVFETEPLAKESPLWGFDNAIITPHVAAVSDTKALAEYVARQLKRYEAGEEFENIVDPQRQY